MTASGGAIIVSDYSNYSLQSVSPLGEIGEILCQGPRWPEDRSRLYCPHAAALRGDGTAWVLEDHRDAPGAEIPDDWFPFGHTLVLLRLESEERLVEVVLKYQWKKAMDLALAGEDALLVLCDYPNNADDWFGTIQVRDAATGALRYEFGSQNPEEGLRGPSSLAVHGDLVYVADTHNHAVQVFRLDRYGQFVRRFGKSEEAPVHMVGCRGIPSKSSVLAHALRRRRRT